METSRKMYGNVRYVGKSGENVKRRGSADDAAYFPKYTKRIFAPFNSLFKVCMKA